MSAAVPDDAPLSAADRAVLRDAAERHRDLASSPKQAARRRLWTDHYSNPKSAAVPVQVHFGEWNAWCRAMFPPATLRAADPQARAWEQRFRIWAFQDSLGDDAILEPWLAVDAVKPSGWAASAWGAENAADEKPREDGAYHILPALPNGLDDLDRVVPLVHRIDEPATERRRQRLHEAIGDVLPVGVNRAPAYTGFNADLSTALARLLGLEAMMVAMLDDPDRLHALLAKMRDGILAAHEAAEAAGDWTPAAHHLQGEPYKDGLAAPAPDAPPCGRARLWTFCAAQEFASVGPAMHEEFCYAYQRPIHARFGAMHYGCCEDLTRKLDGLFAFGNLASVAAAPLSDPGAIARRVGDRCVVSWRPNPTDVTCGRFDGPRLARLLDDGLAATRDARRHIMLKDVETIQDDPTRLTRWVALAKQAAERAGGEVGPCG